VTVQAAVEQTHPGGAQDAIEHTSRENTEATVDQTPSVTVQTAIEQTHLGVSHAIEHTSRANRATVDQTLSATVQTAILCAGIVFLGGGGVYDSTKVERKFPTTFWNM
jgi:hypothetical protein